MRRNSWLSGFVRRLTQKTNSRVGRRLNSRHTAIATELLEERALLTTAITFAGNVLTINVGAANETATLSVAGNNLSIASDNAGGTCPHHSAQ